MPYIMDLRRYIGSSPLILTGSTVIVEDDQGRILLQRRVDTGLWGIPGGSMELGESFEDAAIREVREETGLDVAHLSLLGLYSGQKTFYTYPNGDQTYSAIAVFYTRDFSGTPRGDGEESDDVQFIPPPEFPSLNGPDAAILSQFLCVNGKRLS